ncbi:VOC family protein [Streptomyces sp. RerS4]|uniref:VOC family protein n=1 Tax=Streptomyces sp. RerS4 TaxID=2942449 RepID=UPI00201C1B19|nr:VOC family protein [Streptomyces sp. RerS4]UQX01592.1 VOC family protein [Streptomyces sp. RerS4]
MTSLVRHVTFDCSDAYSLARFWANALGGTLADDDAPGDPMATVTSAGAALLFIQVPEGKTVKNRVHLDLQPQDRSRDDEVEHLHALGAKIIGDYREPDGTGWVTMTDPEGNEFCVERSAPERAKTQ